MASGNVLDFSGIVSKETVRLHNPNLCEGWPCTKPWPNTKFIEHHNVIG